LELLLFRNVKNSSALVNLASCIGLLLDRIPVSSVQRATLRRPTLKPKNLKKPKNLNIFLNK